MREIDPYTRACQRAAMSPQAFLAYLTERVDAGGCVPGMWIDEFQSCPVHDTTGQCFCGELVWKPCRWQVN
jgi:hypothetical protein